MIKQLRQRGAHLVDIAHQIGCSERTVRRHLARDVAPTGRPAQPLPSKQTVCFETQPGFQLQHDWGEIETVMAGQRCKVNFAVNTLGYSRRFHAWAAPSQDAEHTYEALVQAFRYFGGVPRTVLVDSQKAAVLKHDHDRRVIFNTGFLQLANHYGFAPKACRPQRPRTKGKTERMVGYVKQHFFQRYRQFESYAHLNQLLQQWLERVADERPLRQFRQTPAERFVAEREALQALPASDFDTRYHDLRQVGRDGYIEVRGNRYCVPDTYCGQAVVIRLSLDDELTSTRVIHDVFVTHLPANSVPSFCSVPWDGSTSAIASRCVETRSGNWPAATRGTTSLMQERPSQATLSRLLNRMGMDENIDVLHEGLLRLVIWRLRSLRGGEWLNHLTLDIDGLPIEVFGHQGGSVYHGHVGARIYSPLIASLAETGDMLGGLLREGNAGPAENADTWIPHLVRRLNRVSGPTSECVWMPASPTTIRWKP